MDRVPGAGGPPGPDGAFERFLTAAIATIITIMFSWRLLAEEEEAAARGEGGPAAKRPPVEFRHLGSGYGRFDPTNIGQRYPKPPSLSDTDVSDTEESVVGSRSDDVVEKVISERFEPQTQVVLNATPEAQGGVDVGDISVGEGSSDQDTLTTWDEYKWEEELGQEDEHVIKTRRSLRDFVKSPPLHLQNPPKDNTHSGPDMESIDAVASANSEDLASTKSPVVPFTQRFANFEYKDTGGDSGYVDLYPDSDTSDSSDDENVYEIQVSDSDSDSEGERGGGSFFGVTALDTIMEEYESDISDVSEKREEGSGENAGSAGKNGNDWYDNKFADTWGLDTECSIERPEISAIIIPDTTVEHKIQMTQNNVNRVNSCMSAKSVEVTEGSQAEKAESNLSPEITCKAESLPTTQRAGPEMLQECDLAVNNIPPVTETNLGRGKKDTDTITSGNLNDFYQARKSDFTNITKGTVCQVSRESQYKTNSAPDEMKLPLARKANIESNIFEISDENSPSSPIRTYALDDIVGDNFSDTESCSSESVVTVLSVRSNDSDSLAGERYDVTASDLSGQSGQRQFVAAGQTVQSLNINDLSNDGTGSYENNSLVSGFLNDSLNSLLSANNDDTDTESEEGLIDQNNADKDKTAESSNVVLASERVQTESCSISPNNETNSSVHVDSHIDDEHFSTQPVSIECENYLSESNEIIFPETEERLDSAQIARDTQLNIENEHNISDNSSDSSDPPLREYDPDEDDLAAFQFNLDSDCDNDSFYLLVGNEGSLRNFETFTNLNSLELSPEYGDAVTSHTLTDDAHGFKFSYTEEINTDFKKRSYFTDRNVSSDSEARSDDPLSPITSEDEEMVATENDKNEKFLIDPKPKVDLTSTYDDAELSASATDNTNSNDAQSTAKRAIDFQKYIIQPEPTQQSEFMSDADKIRPQNGNKDVNKIDEESSSNRCQIDDTGVIADSPGERGINYKTAAEYEEETFSSLTEKIRSLSMVSESSDTSESEKESKGEVTSSSVSDVRQRDAAQLEPENETKVTSYASLTQDSKQNSKSKETNIDEIFFDSTTTDSEAVVLEIKCSAGKLTDTDRVVQTKCVPISTTPDRVHSSRSLPNGSKLETVIDDALDKQIDSNSPVPSVVAATPTRSKIETNIDDSLDGADFTRETNARTNSKIETNIDDIFNDVPRTEQKLSYESFVDDLFHPVAPSCVGGEQSAPREVTSESATSQPSQPAGGTEIESRAPRKTVASEPDPRENSNSAVRSDDHVPNQRSTCAGVSRSDRQGAYSPDNGQPRDRPADGLDKISDTTSVENNVYLNIETPNNEREYERPIKNISKNLPLLHSTVERDLNKDSSSTSEYNQTNSVTKQSNFNNDTNNNSEFGLHPDRNNANNYTQDCSPLAQVAPSGKLPDNTRDTADIQHTVGTADIQLRIYEDDENSQKSETENSEILDNLSSVGSTSFVSDDESFHSVDENLLYQYSKLRARGLSESSLSRVVRSPLTKPSELFGRSKDLGQGVKRRVHRHHLKKYTSVLQQPITPDKGLQGKPVVVTSPDRLPSSARLKVLQSRQRFLSAENLSGESFEEKFLQHRTSLVSSTPRKYLKRHERHLAELQSTESLPADMSHVAMMNTSYDSYTGIDKMNSLPSPRNIEELYASRYSSANSSFEKPDHHKLHANCIFSPEKREEIRHTTQSLENMFEQLLRYGSVSSVAETDLDAPQPQSLQNSDLSHYVSFQYPLERAASMSAITGSSDGERLPRKPGKGRFSKRNVPKSKSLQTLETNLDDVFADEHELTGGGLKKAPSVHELRVSKSLSKLNVPDWFSKSTFSRSDSTQSLFTYAGRLGSTSTLGSCAYPPSITSSPAPTPGSQTVIIQKRVTPSPQLPSSAKLLRAPALPTTPEGAPIHPTGLPSDKFRKTERKDLKPIPIIPFAKLRAMFETKSQASEAKATTVSPVTSPTKEKAPKVRFEPVSPTKDSNPTGFSSCRETEDDSRLGEMEPVQNRTTSKSPPPPLPERKPILADSARRNESAPNAQPRRTQVHFSDEPNVSKSQEQNSNVVQQNGTSSKPKSTVKKSGLRASLPLPQFRFRRPGPFATKATPAAPAPQAPASSSSSPQNKKETTV